MKQKIELLAPGGDLDSIKAAILAGANAIYCGLDRFNARNRAENISLDNLKGVLRIAHEYNCEVFVTLNIIIVESEIPALIGLLNKLVNTSIDGIIIQDLGLFYILNKHFKNLKIHASTQLTTHNSGQIKFLSHLNTERVNLSRELNIHEIKKITAFACQNNVKTEVFVHGSYCISFSGICYMSSFISGNSGNRGRCSQPCRDRYETTAAEKNYPLNLKDNSAYFDLKELAEAGISSLKIEGRIKKFDYVFTIVDAWRKQLNNYYSNNKLIDNNETLYKVFNRDFSNGFLKEDINKNMFIDDPRDHSIKHLSEINDFSDEEEKENAELKLYDEKDEIKILVAEKIKTLSFEKIPLTIYVTGRYGEKLCVFVKSENSSFQVVSDIILGNNGKQELNEDVLLKRLKAINDTDYFIENLNLSNLSSGVFLPFGEITSIKNRILFILNGKKDIVDPIEIPDLEKSISSVIDTELSVLISSESDIDLINETSVKIYFQLPNSFKNGISNFVKIFQENKNLIPWFPSVLIGKDYDDAVKFLLQIKPNHIVTNNTGIAFEAFENRISWIAGPYLNIVNSYSLKTLKENFNCSGAFISNELSRQQIKAIKRPDNFKLYYSIYHPIVLMTSRQCLFHQIDGCAKNKIDGFCLQNCEKTSSITNLKKQSFIIEKSKGNYNNVFNEVNFLNTEIVSDLVNCFSGFLIDLRKIETLTKINTDKANLINLFEKFVNGSKYVHAEIKTLISPSTNSQYHKGI